VFWCRREHRLFALLSVDQRPPAELGGGMRMAPVEGAGPSLLVAADFNFFFRYLIRFPNLQ